MLWDDKVIKRYKNQPFKKSQVIAMKRYLDSEFYPDLVLNVVERQDARNFLFSDLISQSTFIARMKQIKRYHRRKALLQEDVTPHNVVNTPRSTHDTRRGAQCGVQVSSGWLMRVVLP